MFVEAKAVLFDFDGVIVPPTVNLLAWKKTMKQYGVSMQDKDWYRHEGRGPKFIAQSLIAQYDLSGITADEVSEEKAKIAHYLIEKTPVLPYENVIEILHYLKNKNKRTAIVTGSLRERVKKTIPKIFSLFDVAVTVDDKIDGRKIKEKPDPEPFQIAAEKLSLCPNNCLVVENAPLGVASAKAGGFYCIALLTTVDRNTLKKAGADKIFKSHAALFKYLQKD